jgi:DNA-binding transcriptional ArsR family regulator
MDQSQALASFAALSQETRLAIVRLLVRAGSAGVPAGAVGASASNVSLHLKELERAGLIAARREARSIIYSARYEALRDLIGYLMRDCCAGHPAICTPSLASRCDVGARPRRAKRRDKVA